MDLLRVTLIWQFQGKDFLDLELQGIHLLDLGAPNPFNIRLTTNPLEIHFFPDSL